MEGCFCLLGMDSGWVVMGKSNIVPADLAAASAAWQPRLNFSPLPDDTYLMVLGGVVYMAVPFYKRGRKIEEKPGDIGLAVTLAGAEEGEVADMEDARGNRLLAVVNLEVREAAHGEIGVREDDGDNGGPKPGWRRGRSGGGSTRSSARAGCRVGDGGALSLSLSDLAGVGSSGEYNRRGKGSGGDGWRAWDPAVGTAGMGDGWCVVNLCRSSWILRCLVKCSLQPCLQLQQTHMLIATGRADVQVRLCDIASGAFTHTLSGHHDGIMSLEWSASSEWVFMSGGCDGAIRFWDIRRAGCFRVLDQSQSQLGRRSPLLKNTTENDQIDSMGPSTSRRSKPHKRTGNSKNSPTMRKGQNVIHGHLQQRLHLGLSSSQNRATSHYGAVTGLQTTKHGMYLLSSV
ncbi:hypothetical protein PVAP13_5NG500786 [Panicum virgatum]|uniref:Uncharacterized protein n=1 Tax=Panicum virgatum TaxID=38727 RepID=A0A8T0S4J1_PANVG|nr:hypothetical protein PVAP13_5NG500786 [Panicum virgatum]